MKNKIIFFNIFLFFLVMKVDLFAQEIESIQIDSTQLKETIITCYLEDYIVSGKNLIYCSTFQIAWNELIDVIIKSSLKLENDPKAGEALNKKLTSKKDLQDDSYVALAGFNKDGIVEKIKKALKDKFNTNIGINIILKNPDDILAYAFLLKHLKFENDFEKLDNPIMFKSNPMFDGRPVQGFGIVQYKVDPLYQKIIGQVNIFDYQNNDDFIISLKSVSSKDEIILAKINPQETLLKTIDYVFLRINNKTPSNLIEDETLQIPKINFNILHEFLELENKRLLNKGFEEYFIAKAIQVIKFKLDEKGALLRSEAAIGMLPLARRDSSSRRFIFDKPFLICLREKGAKYPYFAMWIDNAELLTRQERSSLDSGSYSLKPSGFGFMNNNDSGNNF